MATRQLFVVVFGGVLGLWQNAVKSIPSPTRRTPKTARAPNRQNFEKLQTQFAEQKAVLPEKYVLREDYIRNQAILEAKMDSIQKTLTDLYKMESAKK